MSSVVTASFQDKHYSASSSSVSAKSISSLAVSVGRTQLRPTHRTHSNDYARPLGRLFPTHRGSAAKSTRHSSGNCSSTRTIDLGTETIIVTSTITINQTMAVPSGITNPAPLLITPSACHTTTRSCASIFRNHCPNYYAAPYAEVEPPRLPMVQSTLLVTKKNPFAIGQGQEVSRLFSDPTPQPQAPVPQPLHSNGPDAPSAVPPLFANEESRPSAQTDKGGPEENGVSVASNDKPSGGQSSGSHSPDGSGGGQNGGSTDASFNQPPAGFGQSSPDGDEPPASGPSKSISVGDIPVVLHPDHVVIGSQTYDHKPSVTSATYHGQIYNWDANNFVGLQTTVAFPAANEAPVPVVTAAGQAFSVYPSNLKAPGLTINIPTTLQASPFVYHGQIFSVDPSQLIAPGKTIAATPTEGLQLFVYDDNTFSVGGSRFIGSSTTMPLSAGFGVVTYNEQKLTIEPSQVIGPSTIIPLFRRPGAGSAETPLPITTDSLTFSLGPSAAVFGSSTYAFESDKLPVTTTVDGQRVVIGPHGVQIGTDSILLPTPAPSFSVITEGNLKVSLGPSAVVIDGHTASITYNASPFTTEIEGQVFTIGANGVVHDGTTISLPSPTPTYQVLIHGDLTVSLAGSSAVISGSTFAIGPNLPATMVVDGQTFSINPGGVEFPATTVALPTPTHSENYKINIADGLTFSVGLTDVIVDGKTYAIGPNAPFHTITVGSESVKFGPNGIILPDTTIAPEQTPISIIADGAIVSADASEAVINGHTYQIGSGAMQLTVIDDGVTLTVGPSGIILPAATIVPSGMMTASATMISGGSVGAAPTAKPTGLSGSPSVGIDASNHGAGAAFVRPTYNCMVGFIVGILLWAFLAIF